MGRSGARWIVGLALAGALTAGAGVAASAWLGGGPAAPAGAEAALPGTGAGTPWPEVRVIRVPPAPGRGVEDGQGPAPGDVYGTYDDDDGWVYDQDEDEDHEEHDDGHGDGRDDDRGDGDDEDDDERGEHDHW